MKLKGDWDASTTYDVGDVLRYDGVVYHMTAACAAGISPHDTLYWNRMDGTLQEVLSMMVDMMNAQPKNIDDEAITLKTETAEYLITVDDSGDTPELSVTAIEEES